MKLLTNENVAGSVVKALRDAGFDVLSAKESMRGAPDPQVLARAASEHRVLVTHDKDFGDLAVRQGLPATSGVILVRLQGLDRDALVRRLVSALTSRSDWAGHMSTLTKDKIRMRELA